MCKLCAKLPALAACIFTLWWDESFPNFRNVDSGPVGHSRLLLDAPSLLNDSFLTGFISKPMHFHSGGGKFCRAY